jgi:hypothetical protein
VKIVIDGCAVGTVVRERLGGSEFLNRRTNEPGVLLRTPRGSVFLAQRVLARMAEVLRDGGSATMDEFVEEELKCGAGRRASTRSVGQAGRGSKRSASQRSAAGGGSRDPGRRSMRAGT